MANSLFSDIEGTAESISNAKNNLRLKERFRDIIVNIKRTEDVGYKYCIFSTSPNGDEAIHEELIVRGFQVEQLKEGNRFKVSWK